MAAQQRRPAEDVKILVLHPPRHVQAKMIACHERACYPATKKTDQNHSQLMTLHII